MILPDGGDITGVIVEAGTGKGLPKTHVMINEQSPEQNLPIAANRMRNLFQATTDDDGKFQFKSVPVGTYEFRVLPAERHDLVLRGKVDAEVKAGQTVQVNISMVKGRRITGRILVGISDRLMDHPCQINMTPGSEGMNTFWSQQYGTFTTYLVPGSYQLQATDAGGTGPIQEVIVDDHNPTPPVTLRTSDPALK